MVEVEAALKDGQLSVGQLLDIQHEAAKELAALGDSANIRLIALQDWANRALERCNTTK